MADVPVPDTTAEEEFDLFGPGPVGAAGGAAQLEANPFAPAQGLAPAPAQASVPAAATSSPTSAPVPPVQSPKAAAPRSSRCPGGQKPGLRMPGFMMEMLRQQREMMAMNQQLVATMRYM
eukprot:s11136_g1.t1